MRAKYLIVGLMIGWFTASAYWAPTCIRLRNDLEFVKKEWEKSHNEHMKVHQEFVEFANMANASQKESHQKWKSLVESMIREQDRRESMRSK